MESLSTRKTYIEEQLAKGNKILSNFVGLLSEWDIANAKFKAQLQEMTNELKLCVDNVENASTIILSNQLRNATSIQKLEPASKYLKTIKRSLKRSSPTTTDLPPKRPKSNENKMSVDCELLIRFNIYGQLIQ